MEIFRADDPGLMTIKTAIAGSRSTNKILEKYGKITPKLPIVVPHGLFYGASGCGKSTRVLESVRLMGCSEEGGTYRALSPDTIGSTEELIDILVQFLPWEGYLCNAGRTSHAKCSKLGHKIIDPIHPRAPVRQTVIFMDEIHVLPKDLQEKLGLILLDFKYETYTLDQGLKTVYFPKFTFFAATTKPGDLIKPLRTRFVNKFSVNYYSDEEMLQIVNKMLDQRGLKMEEEGKIVVARMSQGTAREAENHITGIFNTWIYELETGQTDKKHVITKEIALKYINIQKFTEDGLSYDQIKILKYLTSFIKPGGKRIGVGVARICSALALDEKRFADELEPRLVHRGFLTSGGRGREITESGLHYLQDNAAKYESI